MSFKRLDPEDISISAESIVAPAWTGQQTTLSTFYTSSAQVGIGAGQYYYNIYQSDFDAGVTGAEVQFSLGYGNILGSGSTPLNSSIPGLSPSSIIYGQYRNLINGDENANFKFGTVTPNSILTISVNRSRFKEKLLPGSFNLSLTSGSTTINLTDNSETLTTVSYLDAGRVYDIVSGSNGNANTSINQSGFTFASGSYGKFLPDVGVIVLNVEALKAPIAGGGLALTSINEGSNINPTVNLTAFYNMLKAVPNFQLKSEETVTSDYVFVRVRNSEFNYSTNPSIISSSGELRYDVLVNSPQVYVTTVGMYNDNNDLLGVAKLSKPLLKDFTKEALIRIKLDY